MLKNQYKILLLFLLVTTVTAVISILDIAALSNAWCVILLIAYYNSKNESFWLAFILTTTDGFLGFLGIYSIVLNILPGLPGVELSQFYILIGFYKIWKSKKKVKVFYGKWTALLFSYVIVLFAVGYINGLSGDLNIYFRVVKLILPLALFYTVPRLINSIEQYAVLFNFLFFVFMFAFAAQLFTVFTGLSPAANFKGDEQTEMEVGRNLRTFYNPAITILALCGSLFFLAIPNQKHFSNSFLNAIYILCFGMAFLSGTRGYILGFGMVIVLFNIFIVKLAAKKLILIFTLFIVFFSIAMSFERLNKQIMFSLERTLTLESLAKGDKSADGTLIRLDERGPAVIAEWEKNPISGAGFSNAYFEKMDSHVGNQTVLLHSGIIGVSLMFLFMVFVANKLFKLRSSIYKDNPYRKGGLVILIFFMGWFFIHSTSHQQFAFYGLPLDILPQAVVLSLANFVITFKA